MGRSRLDAYLEKKFGSIKEFEAVAERKYEAVEKEFPWLRTIAGSMLQCVIEAQLIQGYSFQVRRIHECELFRSTGEDDGKLKESTWVVYESSSSREPCLFGTVLPAKQPLWAAFPPPNHAPGFFPSREFVAVVKIRDNRDADPGFQWSVKILKMPSETWAKRSFFDTLHGIRQVAGWRRDQIYDYPVGLGALSLGDDIHMSEGEKEVRRKIQIDPVSLLPIV